MRRELEGLLVVLALSSWSPFAGAQGQGSTVSCPAPHIDAELATRLPAEWVAQKVRAPLLGTEVRDIGGRPVLVCNYQGLGGPIPVMREPPAGASCKPTQGGFNCSPTTQASAPAPTRSTEVTAATQVRANAPSAPNAGKDPSANASAGTILNSRGTRDVATALAGCPDPAVANILARGISRQSANVYNFVLTGIVRNEGKADYRSTAGQQEVQVMRTLPGTPSNLVKTQRFENLGPGDPIEVTQRELDWNTTTEFPPSFEFVIVYDPDIVRDGNPANDDCRAANNRRSITGAEINAQIRASGR